MDADSTIANYHNWLYKTAREILSPTDPGLDDLVQEGRVAMWLALDSYNASRGSLPFWLTMKAKSRMVKVARGERLTGQPSRMRGQDSAREPYTLSLDAPRTEDGRTLADIVPDPSNVVERAELATHHAEITAAIRKLSPVQQRYLVTRFYGQLTNAEQRNAQPYSYDPAWNQPGGSREKLAEELAHLREVDG